MNDFFEQVICQLAEAKVDFVVVGGVSAVMHGAMVFTLDLDICYHREPANIARLAAALAPFKPRLRGLPTDLPNIFDERSLSFGTNFTLEIGEESVDLLGEMIAIGAYEQIIEAAEEMEIAGHRVKILSLSHLIQTKEAAGRPKDLIALPVLKAALKLKQQESHSD